MADNIGSPPPTRCNFNPLDIFGSAIQFNINGSRAYKTFFGFLFTLVMCAGIFGAAAFYLYQYISRSEMSISSQHLMNTESPLMDFKGRKLFFTLLFQNGEQYIKPGDVEAFFFIEVVHFAYTSTINSTSGERTYSSAGPTVSLMKFAPCRSANMTAKVGDKPIFGKTSMALSDFGYCSIWEDDTPMYLQGDEDADDYGYIQVRIFPCSGPMFTGTGPIPKGSCYLPNLNDVYQKFTQPDLQKLRTTLRDYKVSLALIDTTVDQNNYDDPLMYMLSTNLKFSLTSNSEKSVKIFFKTVQVETDKGELSKSYEVLQGIKSDHIIFDSMDRDPDDKMQINTPQGVATRALPYITLTLLSGNVQEVYTRTYMKLLDVIGMVGGVTSSIMAFIAIAYGWYNQLRMQQDLVNKVILYLDDDDTTLEPWEIQRGFSLLEVFRFTYLKFMNSKKPRCKFFEQCKRKVESSIDIQNIIKALIQTDILTYSLLTRPQRALMKFAANPPKRSYLDESPPEAKKILKKNGEKQAPPMTLKEAVVKVNLETKIINDPIRDKISSYLFSKLPAEALEPIPKKCNILSKDILSMNNRENKYHEVNTIPVDTVPSENNRNQHDSANVSRTIKNEKKADVCVEAIPFNHTVASSLSGVRASKDKLSKQIEVLAVEDVNCLKVNE